MPETTLYEVLGVTPDAQVEQIKAAYRRMVRQVHPDTGGNAALFRLVNEAWETLSDENRRRAYDRKLAEPEARHQTPKESDFPSEENPQADWTSTPGGASEEDAFARAYQQEAARARRAKEAEAKLAADMRADYESLQRTRARSQREDELRTRAAAEEVRVLPYIASFRSLKQRDQRLHTDRGVPLTFLLRWRRMRRWTWGVLLLVCLTAGLIVALTSDNSTNDANPIYLLLNLPTALLGALLFYVPLRIVGGIFLAVVRAVAMPRRSMTGRELQEEYLAGARARR